MSQISQISLVFVCFLESHLSNLSNLIIFCMLFYFTPVCPGLRAGGGGGEGGGDLLKRISQIPRKIVKRNSDRKEGGVPPNRMVADFRH